MEDSIDTVTLCLFHLVKDFRVNRLLLSSIAMLIEPNWRIPTHKTRSAHRGQLDIVDWGQDFSLTNCSNEKFLLWHLLKIFSTILPTCSWKIHLFWSLFIRSCGEILKIQIKEGSGWFWSQHAALPRLALFDSCAKKRRTWTTHGQLTNWFFPIHDIPCEWTNLPFVCFDAFQRSSHDAVCALLVRWPNTNVVGSKVLLTPEMWFWFTWNEVKFQHFSGKWVLQNIGKT